MRGKHSVGNRKNQINEQLKNYARLTKGDTSYELDEGYWCISNKRYGGFAWCRIKSDGSLLPSRPLNIKIFILVKNPTELDGKSGWEEFSSYGNSMDFNNDNCHWRAIPSSYGPWSVTGSDYQIPA